MAGRGGCKVAYLDDVAVALNHPAQPAGPCEQQSLLLELRGGAGAPVNVEHCRSDEAAQASIAGGR